MQCHHWKNNPSCRQLSNESMEGQEQGWVEGEGGKEDSQSHVHQSMSTIHAHEIHDYGMPYKSAYCKHPKSDGISSSFACQYVMSLCSYTTS